jgi:DNA-directed RNA polymerase beta subunit/intein/homing endonuclease
MKYHYSDLRNVIDQFFQSNDAILVQHQLDSFNNFIEQLIPKILHQYNPIIVYGNYNEEIGKHEQEIRINFGEISMHPPMLHENNGLVTPMTPDIARLRNLTYSSNLHVNINIETVMWKGDKLEIRDSKSKNWDNILIGKIPIMVKSRYCCENGRVNPDHCIYDKGGYFIVTGSEKVIISQERQSENKAFCFKSIASPKFSHVVEVKSVPKEGFMPAKTTAVKIATKPGKHGKSIYITFQGSKKEIPMVILFRAIGCSSDKEISYYVFANKSQEMKETMLPYLEASFEEASSILTQESALEYISKNLVFPMSVRIISTTHEKKIENTIKALDIDLLPHLGKNKVSKYIYLGMMIKKILLYSTKRITDDDRDSFENKRVDTPGIMLGNLLRQSFTKLIKDMNGILTKEINTGVWKMSGDFHNIITVNNIYKVIKSNIIEANVKYSLATGNWGIKNTTAKVGVAQVLQRLSYLGTLSHQRRINTPIDKTSKMTKPRKLHSSTFGYTCPAETPEGAPVGFVKNMALSSNITIARNETNVLYHINEFNGFKTIDKMTSYKTNYETIIIFNGDILGCINNMIPLINNLKTLRRDGVIHAHTSIVPNYQDRELNIYTSGGRLIRPLFIVKSDKNELVFGEKHKNYIKNNNNSWEVLVHGCEKNNILPAIEYIDVQESNTIMLCDHANRLENLNNETRVKYTHCEIDPSLMLGVLASNIPFSDHNQSPRNCYQCLDKDELILMANGKYKPIGHIDIGEKVVTFDPETMKTFVTKAIYQHVNPTTKKIFEVTTVSGRKIVATYDHKFLTNEGWKEIQHFNKNTLVAVYPHKKPMCDKNYNTTCDIITSESVKIALEESLVKQSLIKKYIGNLNRLHILPLKHTNENIPLLAGILGYAFSNASFNYGGMTPQCQFNFGTLCSAEEFENDISKLGFINSTPCRSLREGHECINHTFGVCHSGSLSALLIALGAHKGHVTDCPQSEIPHWIMNGSDEVKREFISGFQGGGKKTYNGISQTIIPEFETSLHAFMNQLKTLYEHFEIVVHNICRTIDKKNGEKVVLRLNTSNSQENLIKLFEIVGFKYDDRKHKESALAVEFFHFKNELIQKHKIKIEKIRKYFDDGFSNKEIGVQMNLSIQNVKDIVNEYKLKIKIKFPDFKNNTLDYWMQNVQTKENAIFVPIKDVLEVNNRLISDITTESNSHCFVTASGFAVHNSAMGKQAMGVYSTKFRKRMDTLANILWYPSTPLVMTHNSKHMNMHKIPNGSVIIIAIAGDKGYNQEDSLIFNKSSIERGLFRSNFFRTYNVEEKKNQSTGEEDHFSKPDPSNTSRLRPCNYDGLGDDGFPILNSKIKGGDAIIGKVVPITNKKKNQNTSGKEFQDNSVYLRDGEDGIVDNVYSSRNADGYVFCKVKMRSERTPSIGDKFSSTSGQKGTIGMIYKKEDMPYTKDGIVPDVIMNPHAMPSRMTFAQLLETLLGIECLESGMVGDGTPFTNINMDDIAERLEERGINKYGEHDLYSGETGVKTPSSVFMGPAFYQRLKHMVEDKIHARSQGPIVAITRQSSEGRSRMGGLRVGEMERDVLISHGIAQFQKEKFMELSDNFTVHVNKRTGMMCAVNKKDKICNSFSTIREEDNETDNVTDEVTELRMPYACKLMFHELITMGVDMQLNT